MSQNAKQTLEAVRRTKQELHACSSIGNRDEVQELIRQLTNLERDLTVSGVAPFQNRPIPQYGVPPNDVNDFRARAIGRGYTPIQARINAAAQNLGQDVLHSTEVAMEQRDFNKIQQYVLQYEDILRNILNVPSMSERDLHRQITSFLADRGLEPRLLEPTVSELADRLRQD